MKQTKEQIRSEALKIKPVLFEWIYEKGKREKQAEWNRFCLACKTNSFNDGKREGKAQALKQVLEIIDERFEWWAMNNCFKIKQWKWLKRELKAEIKKLK